MASWPTSSCATAAARAEDRIRIAKDTGLANLPLHGFDANRLWCQLVLIAMEVTAWTQLLAFGAHAARRWEPKRLRHRVFTIPATLARTGRRVRLHLKNDAAYAQLVLTGWTTMAGLAPP